MTHEGTYPAPPFWPERLATFAGRPPFTLEMALTDTDEVRHTYIADGYPGPCWTDWSGCGVYIDWWPAMTIDRAELGASL